MRMAALMVTVGLVLSACGGSGSDEPLPPEVLELLEALGQSRTDADLSEAVAAAADHDDPRAVPYLVDLLQVEDDEQRRSEIAEALGRLTDLASTEGQAHVVYGSWLLDRPEIIPPASYPAWKGRLYAELSPDFELLLAGLEPRLAAEVQWVGVPFNGIPAINTPALINPAGADYLAPGDLVFGAELLGVSRAYPLRILDVHELSNDVLAGQPVVLANCTLCRSATLFSRTVDGRELEFVTSGLLLDSNKLMVDTETRSLWQQLTGAAIAGPLAGSELTPLFLTTTTWDDWRTAHPDTLVMARPDARGPALAVGDVSYEEGGVYSDYFTAPELWFPAPTTGGGRPKVAVIGVVRNDRALAIELEALAEHGLLITTVGGDFITAVPTAGAGARVFLGSATDADVRSVTESHLRLSDGRSLPRVHAVPAFWFSWASVHTDSDRWP